MLRWMMGKKRIEKIGNEEVRATAGLANISEKLREAILRWLGHVERKIEEDVVMRTRNMEVGGHRKLGRAKLMWSDVIRKDMKESGERRKYRRRTRPESVEIENSMRQPHRGKDRRRSVDVYVHKLGLCLGWKGQ